jgi:hypothetical protein
MTYKAKRDRWQHRSRFGFAACSARYAGPPSSEMTRSGSGSSPAVADSIRSARSTPSCITDLYFAIFRHYAAIQAIRLSIIQTPDINSQLDSPVIGNQRPGVFGIP